MFVDSKNDHGFILSSSKGFTLVELLVVIAIILILAAALLFAINPAELLKKSRDSQRVSDLNALSSAINLFIADSQIFTTTSTVTSTFFTLTAACPGTEVPMQVGSANTRVCAATTVNNGSGWVNGINFQLVSSGAPVSALPLDPTNSVTAPGYYYRFCHNGSGNTKFRMDANLEASSNDGKETGDGGNFTNRFEIGNDLTICDPT